MRYMVPGKNAHNHSASKGKILIADMEDLRFNHYNSNIEAIEYARENKFIGNGKTKI